MGSGFPPVRSGYLPIPLPREPTIAALFRDSP
jgi:hypothetical protein